MALPVIDNDKMDSTTLDHHLIKYPQYFLFLELLFKSSLLEESLFLERQPLRGYFLAN